MPVVRVILREGQEKLYHEAQASIHTPGSHVADCPQSRQGFDHGVGHPLLLLGDAEAPNRRNNKAFNDLDRYSEWPKVADAVLKALETLPFSPQFATHPKRLIG